MDIIDNIKSSLLRAQSEEEFPDYMTAVILRIIATPEQFSADDSVLEKLNFMISDYDTYAETCCEKLGTSPMDMEHYLKKITGEDPSDWI